ncbi:DNA-binding response regulator, LytR/AlgR family [Tenacibaculum sp. 190524A02b]|uniref:LytR/AlgR family response regulator transcription factor n=1 Tax=Tenacibaculum vairaonense TaxID=3137860 RepID=UPI0032B1A874
MIKVYVVEDIAISRMSLETMLLENNYEVSGSSAKAEIAWEEILKSPPNLILLDINLAGDKNGVWLAQQIRKHLKIAIVYLTAYGDQQTLKEVLETKPNGFLMKPYQEPILLTTINIALDNFFESQKINIKINEFVFIKDGHAKIKIATKEIYYVKSDGNYLEVKLKEKIYVIRRKLLEFKEELPQNLFYQSHQRYVVNINKIDMIKKGFITILDKEIPVSLKYKKSIEEAITLL